VCQKALDARDDARASSTAGGASGRECEDAFDATVQACACTCTCACACAAAPDESIESALELTIAQHGALELTIAHESALELTIAQHAAAAAADHSAATACCEEAFNAATAACEEAFNAATAACEEAFNAAASAVCACTAHAAVRAAALA
jgi:hypothetical protein